MTKDEMIEALSADLELGDWFWPEGTDDTIHQSVDELIDIGEMEEPFLMSRSIILPDVWCVPCANGDDDVTYRLFKTEAEALAFFGGLKK